MPPNKENKLLCGLLKTIPASNETAALPGGLHSSWTSSRAMTAPFWLYEKLFLRL